LPIKQQSKSCCTRLLYSIHCLTYIMHPRFSHIRFPHYVTLVIGKLLPDKGQLFKGIFFLAISIAKLYWVRKRSEQKMNSFQHCLNTSKLQYRIALFPFSSYVWMCILDLHTLRLLALEFCWHLHLSFLVTVYEYCAWNDR